VEKKDFIKPDGRSMTLYSRRPISSEILPTSPLHNPITGGSHLRWHPLRGEWVAYAAHRQSRTFLPPKEYSPLAVTKSKEFPTEMPEGDYDMAVFENLFPSLSLKFLDHPEISVSTQAALGHCEVVVFTQDPNTSLGALPADQIQLLLEIWADRTKILGAKKEIQYVMPFENRGVEMGVTLHHPHGQIYCYPMIPPVPQRMYEMQSTYYQQHQKGLLEELLSREQAQPQRVIHQEETALAFIPPFARYPYETWVAPKRKVAWIYELTPAEIKDFARTLKTVLLKFDHLWDKAFPYLMILYQAPTDGQPHPESHMHIEIYPPLRSRDRLKFLAGTELGAGLFINDTLPEEKAQELRAVEVSL
jgi:UDPglucose--hexose-1-phosphate uridylyltransferase